MAKPPFQTSRRTLARLTDLQCKRFKEPGDYADGGNLFLHIGKTGTKSWSFKYERGGRRHELGLGSILTVSLAQARQKADSLRRQLAEGKDPHLEKKAALVVPTQGVTAFQAYEEWYRWKSSNWRSSTAMNRPNPFRLPHCEAIGAKSVNDLNRDDAYAVLKPYENKRPTMDPLRARMERCVDYAVARGWR
jgi:hypothetical protein